jgi:hypothetical protein
MMGGKHLAKMRKFGVVIIVMKNLQKKANVNITRNIVVQNIKKNLFTKATIMIMIMITIMIMIMNAILVFDAVEKDIMLNLVMLQNTLKVII